MKISKTMVNVKPSKIGEHKWPLKSIRKGSKVNENGQAYSLRPNKNGSKKAKNMKFTCQHSFAVVIYTVLFVELFLLAVISK